MLFYVHGKHLWSCRDGQLTYPHFLGRLRPPKRLISTLCTYLRQKLKTALLESAEEETKVCGRTRYPTRDLWLLKQTRGEGTYTDQIGGGGYGVGGGLGRGRLTEGCRNKVERCTV